MRLITKKYSKDVNNYFYSSNKCCIIYLKKVMHFIDQFLFSDECPIGVTNFKLIHPSINSVSHSFCRTFVLVPILYLHSSMKLTDEPLKLLYILS